MMEWRTAIAQREGLGESPFWHPLERKLYWIDIPGRQIRRADPDSGEVESWDVPSDPGCIAPVDGGGLMIALRDGLYCAPAWREPVKLVARLEYDPKTTRANDGKADPAGRFWVGTIYEPRDQGLAKLYSVQLQGDGPPAIRQMADGAVTANGLAWSPDARTVYWSDTPRHVIRAWQWDAASNVMSGSRVLRQFESKPEGWKPGDPGYGGRPDGAAVDAEGNYWCAMFEGARLLKLSPEGEILAEHPVPVRCPTMPCFGGDDLRTLYVTSASHGRPSAELEAMPQSGCIIAARVDVPGLPVNFVKP